MKFEIYGELNFIIIFFLLSKRIIMTSPTALWILLILCGFVINILDQKTFFLVTKVIEMTVLSFIATKKG